MDFEIGDKVVCMINHPDGNLNIAVGSKGTVCNISGRIGVCWDDDVGGHHCDSHECVAGHGWWVDDKDLKLLDGCRAEIDENKFLEIICGTK